MPGKAATRQRLSDEFLKANARERAIAGTAKTIAVRGYCAATVSDIVRTCRTARSTFYDCFGSKEEAALAVVTDVCPGLEVRSTPAVAVLAIELTALWRDGQRDRACEAAVEAERVVRALIECDLAEPLSADDPRQHRLPPGRHGLPTSFIRENQRHRLLSGVADAVAKNGYQGATITDICRRAATSRRTFYAQFSSTEAAALSMVAAASEAAASSLEDVPPESGLGAVAIEIVAERLAGDGEAITTAGRAPHVLRELIDRFATLSGVPVSGADS